MITPTDLTTEYASNPISIDTKEPRFSWLLQSDRRSQSQSAYQILVASSAENLQDPAAPTNGTAARSSPTAPSTSPTPATALSSDEPCHWQLRVWDQNDRASAYTEPAAFTMGLLARKLTGPATGSAPPPTSPHPSCAKSSTSPLPSAAPASISPASAGTSSTSTAGASATMSSTPPPVTTPSASSTSPTTSPTCCRPVPTPSASCSATAGTANPAGSTATATPPACACS